MIPVADVVAKETAIRKVDPKNADYIALVEDLRNHALRQPIWVKKTIDKETNQSYYELADGGHRYSAYKELEKEMIPAIVLPEDTDKMTMLSIQFRLNKLRIKQTVTQEGQQFQRMMSENPGLVAGDLADLTGYTVGVIKDRLKFTDEFLTDEVITLLENGAISVPNAKILARAGKSMQSGELVESAQILDGDSLSKQIKTTQKALADGADPTPKAKEEKHYTPKFKFRNKDNVNQEIEEGTLAKALYDNPVEADAFTEGVRWACSLDDQTVTEAKEAYDLAKSEADRVRADKEIAKAQKKIADMEAKAAALVTETN